MVKKMNKIQKFFEREYNSKSSFQKLFDHDYIVRNMHHWNEKFSLLFKDFLMNNNIKINNLSSLHLEIEPKYLNFETVGNNNNSRPIISDIVYDFVNSNEKVYHQFLHQIYKDVIKEDFYFQKTPTIRVHMPNITQHVTYPNWHSDCMFGHSPRNINIWMGITDNKKSDFFIKTVKDSSDWFSEYNYDANRWIDTYIDMDKEYDVFAKKGFINSFEVSKIYQNVYLFDGRCIHSALHRSEKDLTTKISIDARIILKKDFEWVIIDNKPLFVGTGFKKAH
jgi:hypothetical protein